MNEIEENINKAIAEAQKIRDELSMKSSLGPAVTQEKFSKLNDKYEIFKEKSKKILEAADDSLDELKIAAELGIKAESKEDVLTALELAAEELKYSYQKIQNLVF